MACLWESWEVYEQSSQLSKSARSKAPTTPCCIARRGALERHGSCFSHPEHDCCNMDIGDIGIDGHAHDSSMKVKSLKISLSKAKQPNAGYKWFKLVQNVIVCHAKIRWYGWPKTSTANTIQWMDEILDCFGATRRTTKFSFLDKVAGPSFWEIPLTEFKTCLHKHIMATLDSKPQEASTFVPQMPDGGAICWEMPGLIGWHCLAKCTKRAKFVPSMLSVKFSLWFFQKSHFYAFLANQTLLR